MKWITPIWSDPVGWSEAVAKTPLRIVSWVIIHIIFVTFALMQIYRLVPSDMDPHLKLLIVFGAASPIYFVGVFFPAMYLYAIYRLLRRVNNNS